jgi:hypothetical protein
MDTDGTNTQAPHLGPELPLYPELPQLVRVTGPALVGTPIPIFPCLVQQYAGGLTLRDREPAYVFEPNKYPLGPAIYDCRLVGSYSGLPLYATICCTTGSSSSSR